jgi:hypothetical protein
MTTREEIKCDICGSKISKEQIKFEKEFANDICYCKIFEKLKQAELLGIQEGKSSARQDEIKFLEDYLEMLNVPDYAFKISDFDKKRKIRERLQELKK